MWEESLNIPTYLTDERDKFPIFYSGRAYQGAKGPVYPYPMLDKLTDTRVDRSYKAVYLENEFLKLCVLPELGGRLFSALDKTNGYDFIYRQRVIKPALIGMLGAWISSGVEWNIPHHHRATTFVPVDHTWEESPDGSATVWVGETEWRHRMKWIVGLTLRPGRSSVEVTMKVFNRTPFAHSMLCWANIAVHTNENYQVIFPPGTEYATFHGKNQFSQWPISYQVYNGVDYTSGVDVSWWKNHPAPTSFFAWNYDEDYAAGYDHGRQAGILSFADHNTVPGKKFWTWGTGSPGQRREKILTDADGPYLELMVGAYSDNQPDYSWIEPLEVRTVKMYWFPLREIGGVKKANQEAALNMERLSAGRLQIGFNTTSVHDRANIVLESSGKKIFEETSGIGPDAPYRNTVEIVEETADEEMRLALNSESGEELISYRPAAKKNAPMPETVKPPSPPEEIPTVEELVLTGRRLEQFYNPAFEPYPYYEEALKRDPQNYQASTALGVLSLKRGLFEEAEKRLSAAVDRVTKNHIRPKDGEALYYLGVALQHQGKNEAASDAFHRAAWSSAWKQASYHRLAEVSGLGGDFDKALDCIDESLALNASSTKGLNLKAALLRKQERLSEAEEAARQVLRLDPLDFWAANELVLILSAGGNHGEVEKALENLTKKMRDSAQNYLEVAIDYGNCGFWGEASDVLKKIIERDIRGESTNPMLHYYLGYYLDKKGDTEKALEYFRQASQMSPDYGFLFRLESIEVLQHAQDRNPGDSRAPYYLGNLLYDIQPEEAIRAWEKSAELGEGYSVLHRNLGLAYARVLNDLPKAIASLERALELDPQASRLYFELDVLYEAGGISLEKRLAVLEKNHEVVLQRDDAIAREIELLVLVGQYDRAVRLLEDHHFHVWEGGGRIHGVYVDAHLLCGLDYYGGKQYEKALSSFMKAAEYPDNLEVGRPLHGGRSCQVEYFIGMAYEALGRNTESHDYYERSVSQQAGLSELSYYQALSLEKLGRVEEVKPIFTKLIELGQKRLEDTPDLDFFAKFGEKQSAAKRKAQSLYLMGLGYSGRGETRAARKAFADAINLDNMHVWAQYYSKKLDGTIR